MTIVDRSSEKSDLESVGCKRSGSLNFPGGDGNGMDSACSSWGAGGPSSSDTPRVKTGGCMGPTPGATVYSSSADRPKEQGEEGWCAQLITDIVDKVSLVAGLQVHKMNPETYSILC